MKSFPFWSLLWKRSDWGKILSNHSQDRRFELLLFCMSEIVNVCWASWLNWLKMLLLEVRENKTFVIFFHHGKTQPLPNPMMHVFNDTASIITVASWLYFIDSPSFFITFPLLLSFVSLHHVLLSSLCLLCLSFPSPLTFSSWWSDSALLNSLNQAFLTEAITGALMKRGCQPDMPSPSPASSPNLHIGLN